MIIALTIALCAMLNRFAGGGVWVGEWWNPSDPNKLWGRALYPAIALIGLVALIWHPWPVARRIHPTSRIVAIVRASCLPVKGGRHAA